MWPPANFAPSRTSSTCASAAGSETVRARGGSVTSGPRLSSTMRRHRRRLGREIGVRALDELVDLHLPEHRVEAPLEAERRGRLGRHATAAQRARDVPGEELDAGVERAQALVQRAVERGGALFARDGEVGAPAVADEERVAREHEPRLVAARAIGDDDAAVLGPVARRVQDVERDVADVDAVAVAQRAVLVDGVRNLVDRDPGAVGGARGRRAPRRGRRACGSRSRRSAGRRAARTRASTSRTSSGGSTTTASPAT